MTLLSIPADTRSLIFNELEFKDLGRLSQSCKAIRSHLLTHDKKYFSVISSVRNLNERKYTLKNTRPESADFKFYISDNQFLLPSGYHRLLCHYSGYIYNPPSSNCVVGKKIIVNDQEIELNYFSEQLKIRDPHHNETLYRGVKDIAFFGSRLLIAKEAGLIALDLKKRDAIIFASLKYVRISSDLKSGCLFGLTQIDSAVETIDFGDEKARPSIKDKPLIDKLLKAANAIKEWSIIAFTEFKKNFAGIAGIVKSNWKTSVFVVSIGFFMVVGLVSFTHTLGIALLVGLAVVLGCIILQLIIATVLALAVSLVSASTGLTF